jgi:hypothetical protein
MRAGAAATMAALFAGIPLVIATGPGVYVNITESVISGNGGSAVNVANASSTVNVDRTTMANNKNRDSRSSPSAPHTSVPARAAASRPSGDWRGFRRQELGEKNEKEEGG